MAITLSHTAPTAIVAGDCIEFLVQIPGDYVTWTGSARLTGPTTKNATSCATENGDFHVRFDGGASGTGGLTAGHYYLTVWATDPNDATSRKTVAQFPLRVNPDLSTGTPAQQHAIKMLALVESAIEARISGNSDGGIESYAIDGTTVNKLTMKELQILRAKYSAEVSRLQNPNKGLASVQFAFTPTGSIPDMRRRFG